jgi:hypothetical protein
MDTPWIKQIAVSNGSTEAMVFVSGFTTENNLGSRYYGPWVRCLREAGWNGSVFHFWWDSSNKVNAAMVTYGQLGIGVIPYWEKHKRRAKYSGRDYLEKLVTSNLYEESVSFIGHSLGARVLFFGLRDWGKKSLPVPKNVFLLGGAIPKNRKWSQVAEKIKGTLFNLYNPGDTTLKIQYRVSSLGLYPCGLMPIKDDHPKISNIDVSQWIGKSHKFENYLETFPTLIQQQQLSL